MAREEISMPPVIRMEGVEETERDRPQRIGYARYRENEREEAPPWHTVADDSTARMMEQLIAERQQIISDSKLSARQKNVLLEANRKTLVIAKGGSIKNTENVVYSILTFGGLVIIVLSLLTVYKDLPKEVILSFVGTVLGGTIATIAQKLGKV